MAVRKITRIKEIYNLFKELDLFNLNKYEDFAAKFDPLSDLQEVQLIDILKSLRPTPPKAPKPPREKEPPKIKETEEEAELPLTATPNIGGEEYDKEEEFIIIYNDARLYNWDSSRLIGFAKNLYYYLTNYYDKFLEIMQDYFYIDNFESADPFDLMLLFCFDTNLITIVSFNQDNPDHREKMTQIVTNIHNKMLLLANNKQI